MEDSTEKVPRSEVILIEELFCRIIRICDESSLSEGRVCGTWIVPETWLFGMRQKRLNAEVHESSTNRDLAM